MAAIMCQILPQFYRVYNKTALFSSVSVKEYKQYLILSKYPDEYHCYSFCPLKTSRYPFILFSTSVKEISEKIQNLSYFYQTVDCLYILYKHRFFGSLIEKSGLVFTQLTRALEHILEIHHVEKVPSVYNKWLSLKKFKRHLLNAGARNAKVPKLLDHHCWKKFIPLKTLEIVPLKPL